MQTPSVMSLCISRGQRELLLSRWEDGNLVLYWSEDQYSLAFKIET